MVLEGSTSESAYADNVPASDIDPYASRAAANDETQLQVTQPPNPIFVDLNALPRRFSILTEKPHPGVLLKGIQESCQFAAQVLHRPVKQEEADALAFHFAKTLRFGSYGTPLGVGVGTLLAVRGAKTQRFPFWSPFKEGGRLSPDVFGPLKGQAARSAWNMARLSAYWIVGSIAGQIFMGSYGMSVGLTGRAMDGRLKEFNEEFKKKARTERGGPGARPPDQTPGSRYPETYDMARQRRSAQEIGRRGQQAQKPPVDDASPTGGMFDSDYRSDVSGEPVMQTDKQVEQQAQKQDARRQAAQHQQQQPQQPAQQAADLARTQAPTQQSSAWGRLRQNAMTGQPASPQHRGPPQQTQQSPTTDDPFDLSSGQSNSRSEMQRQFDSSIERERQGKDFDDQSGSRKGGWQR